MKDIVHKLSDSANPDTVSVWFAVVLLLLVILLVRVLSAQVRQIWHEHFKRDCDAAHRRAVAAHRGKLHEHDSRGRN